MQHHLIGRLDLSKYARPVAREPRPLGDDGRERSEALQLRLRAGKRPRLVEWRVCVGVAAPNSQVPERPQGGNTGDRSGVWMSQHGLDILARPEPVTLFKLHPCAVCKYIGSQEIQVALLAVGDAGAQESRRLAIAAARDAPCRQIR